MFASLLMATPARSQAPTGVDPEPGNPIDRFAQRKAVAQEGLALTQFGVENSTRSQRLEYLRWDLQTGLTRNGVATNRVKRFVEPGPQQVGAQTIHSVYQDDTTPPGVVNRSIWPATAAAALGARPETREVTVAGTGGDPEIREQEWLVPDGEEGTVMVGTPGGDCGPLLCLSYYRPEYNQDGHFAGAFPEIQRPLLNANSVAEGTAASVAVGTFDKDLGPSIVVGWLTPDGSDYQAWIAHFRVERGADGRAVGLEKIGEMSLGKVAVRGITLVAGDFLGENEDVLAVVGMARPSGGPANERLLTAAVVEPTAAGGGFETIAEHGLIDDASSDPQQYTDADRLATPVSATAVRRAPKLVVRGDPSADTGRDQLVISPPTRDGVAMLGIDPEAGQTASEVVSVSNRTYGLTASDIDGAQTVVNLGDLDANGTDDLLTADTRPRLGDPNPPFGDPIPDRGDRIVIWQANDSPDPLAYAQKVNQGYGFYGLDLRVEQGVVNPDQWELRDFSVFVADGRSLDKQAPVADPEDTFAAARQVYLVGYYTGVDPAGFDPAPAPMLRVGGARPEMFGGPGGTDWKLPFFFGRNEFVPSLDPNNYDYENPPPGNTQLPPQTVDLPAVERLDFALSPIVTTPLALDGRVEIGEPQRTTVQRIEPMVILNSTPTHFDILDGRFYDLNFCYAGNQYAVPPVCFFQSTYRRSQTATQEVTSTATEDWGVGGSLTIGQEFETGALNPASVAATTQAHIEANYGEQYSHTEVKTTTDQVSVAVDALNTDKIYAITRQYDLLEYPIYEHGDDEPDNWLGGVTPHTLTKRWIDSNSSQAFGYRQTHEPGNILSYPTDIPAGGSSTAEVPFLDSKVFAPDEFELSDSSSYEYELTQERLSSNTEDHTRIWSVAASLKRTGKLGMQVPEVVEANVNYELEIHGNYANSEIATTTTSVGSTTTLAAIMKGVDESLGDVSYTVKPFAYYSPEGALVLDWAAEPAVSPPGFPPTFWQREYGRDPDLSLVLPRRLDVEKQAGISSDAVRFFSPGVQVRQPAGGGNPNAISCATSTELDPAYPAYGRPVCLEATVQNYSLEEAGSSKLRFYVGDPDLGGTPIGNPIDVPGIAPRGQHTVRMQWTPGPEHAGSFVRIFAALDVDGQLTEIHEDNNKGWQGVSIATVDAPPALRAPVEVDARPSGERGIEVSWEQPSGGEPGGARWQVVAYRESDGATRVLPILPIAEETATFAELDAGTWRVIVYAVFPGPGVPSPTDPEAGVGDRSVASYPSEPVEIGAGAPGRPTDVAATPVGGGIGLEWDAPSDEGDSPINAYRIVEYSPPGGSDPVEFEQDGTETEAELTGLERGRSYRFVVHAVNDAGAGEASEPSNAVDPGVVPGVPTGVTATPGTGGTAMVTWQPPLDPGDSPINGYEVVSSPGNVVVTAPGSAAAATVGGLVNGTAYTFTVRARNTRGFGPFSLSSGSVVPADPPSGVRDLSAVPGDGRIEVSWLVPNSDGGIPVNGYRVRVTGSGGERVVAVDTTSALVDGLENGAEYMVSVEALNPAGVSAPVSAGPVVPRGLPSTPRSVVARPGDRSAVVSWVEPETDRGAPLTEYVITGYPGGAQTRVSAANLEANVTGLDNGTGYTFTVAAETQVGRGSESSVSNAVIPTGNPSAPTILEVTPSGEGAIRLAWAPPAEAAGNELTGYRACIVGGACKHLNAAQASVLFEGLDTGAAARFTITVLTKSGKEATSEPSAGVIPEVLPRIAFTGAPADGGVTGGDVSVQFEATPSRSRTICVLDGSEIPCLSPFVPPDLDDGTHTLQLRATNAAGEASTETRTWTVDTTPPEVEVTRLATIAKRGKAPLRFAGSDGGGAGLLGYSISVRRAMFAGPFGGTRVLPDVTASGERGMELELNRGETACVTIEATDAVGNTSASTAERCVTRPVSELALDRRGAWELVKDKGYLGHVAAVARERGALLSTVIARASRVTVLARRCEQCGRLAVSLAGGHVKTVRLQKKGAPTMARIRLLLPAQNQGGLLSLRSFGGGEVLIDGLAVHRVR